MNKRPLCVALGFLVILILLFQDRLRKEPGGIYKGEQKTLQCQVEELDGQDGSFTVTAGDVMEDGVLLCRRMRLYAAEILTFPEDIKVGNILSITGKINSFPHPGNPGQFDEYQYYYDQGISYRFIVQSVSILDHSYKKTEQWLCDLRSALYQQIMACLPSEEGGVVAAVLLGEKCALTDEIRTLYQENGIAHILAISGLHISLIGTGLFLLLRRYVLPMKAAALVTGILLVLYGELTGFSVSAQRAVCMMLCFLAARFLGRRYDLYCALSLSAMIQLFIHPTVLFQAGFLLSYGTVLGIALFVQKFQETDRKYPVLYQTFLGSLGIQLVTMPVLLYHYFEINPYSTFVNIVVLPFISIVLTASAAGGLAAWFSLSAGRFMFGIVHYILFMYYQLCNLVLTFPMASYISGRPAVWQIVLYYLLLFFWIFLSNHCPEKIQGKRNAVRAGVLVLAVFSLFVRIEDKNILRITSLDVGQGDCTCIRLADRTILIDGGSSDVKKVGKYRISKYLKYYGIGTLDYIFITHSDSDHTSGIMEILQDGDHMGFEIGTVVLPDLEKVDEGYEQLEKICHENQVKVKKIKKGDQLQIGQMCIRCIHPYKDYDWSTENDYSLVLDLVYGEFHGLFVGDLEKTGEKEILQQITDADYLKVGHHGSAGSSGEEFLAALNPEIAAISVGEGNRYGHPTPETVERLRAVGADIYSTATGGAVTVTADGREITVSTYR